MLWDHGGPSTPHTANASCSLLQLSARSIKKTYFNSYWQKSIKQQLSLFWSMESMRYSIPISGGGGWTRRKSALNIFHQLVREKVCPFAVTTPLCTIYIILVKDISSWDVEKLEVCDGGCFGHFKPSLPITLYKGQRACANISAEGTMIA